MTDTISIFPEVAADIEQRFGREAVQAIKRVIKQSFDAVPGSLTVQKSLGFPG